MPTKTAAAKTSKAAPKTTAKSAAAKPAIARKTAAKPKIAVVEAKPQVKEESMNEVVEINAAGAKVVAMMKVKDLIDRVATASDQNKKDVRAIVEATLAELGKALEAGETLILPPLGRVRIANQKSDATGQMMTLKLRRGGEKKPGKNAAEALAAADEAS
ncbi:MAG: HU family DNA-binding protein [Pseudomonadota bacterium]